MSEHTGIEWTDHSWPVVVGCERVSPGCANCYALRDGIRLAGNPNPKISRVYSGLVQRGPNGRLDWTGVIRPLPERLNWPLKWKKPARIFVCNQSDLFHESVPDEFIQNVFTVMAVARRHTFQVLTKRPERMRELLSRWRADDMYTYWHGYSGEPAEIECWPLPNVQIGCSVENQHWADARKHPMQQLADLGWFTWVSYEPALGLVDFWDWFPRELETGKTSGTFIKGIRWLVVGGESGPRARPFDVAWARSVIQQCHAHGVPCFVKQLGANPYAVHDGPDSDFLDLRDPKGGDPNEWPEDLRIREYPAESRPSGQAGR